MLCLINPMHNTLKQKGFTLLEMVLVLFLIGLMSSATLMLTEGVEDQAKYDETKRRMELIRKAIVGDPTRTVNGSPEISGFATDMGRLPGCIRELLQAFDCADQPVPLAAWNLDANTDIGSGWRGPYLQVIPESDGHLHFRDGYGNEEANAEEDLKNSGWQLSFNDPPTTINLSSEGLTNNPDDDDDDIDGGEIVAASDWETNTITVNVINLDNENTLPAALVTVNLRVYRYTIDDYRTGTDGIDNFLTIPANDLPPNSERTYTFSFAPDNTVPIGFRGYVLVCYDADADTPNDYVIFDGDCDSGDSGNPKPIDAGIRNFINFPRQNTVLTWTIP